MPAYLVVRAIVAEADRNDFDAWYRTEHLPDAIKAFKAERGWRAWSRSDPSVHYAFYQFPAVAAAQAITQSPAIRPLIAAFDDRWGNRVARTREIIEVVQGEGHG
ncbi:MAG TPA: hypothetical protein VH855_17000 [Acetobacteraceae bacterium]|jgi:hypothetical protein